MTFLAGLIVGLALGFCIASWQLSKWLWAEGYKVVSAHIVPWAPTADRLRERLVAAAHGARRGEDAFRAHALRAAVARLMATGEAWEPWWCDYWTDEERGVLVFACDYCLGAWAESADDVTHSPDCPVLAVEAAMRGET